MNENTTLHAIIDPLCGWCYAAAPLLDEAKKHVSIQLHGGGLFIGELRRLITPDFRAFVVPHDTRIAQLTGQLFGSAYTDGLLNDTNVVLDSTPPIAALLAMQALGGDSVQLLHAMQVAYYQHGKWLSDTATLIHIAEQQGIEVKAFCEAFDVTLPEVDTHLVNSRQLLNQLGGQGFPTFALQTPNGNFIRLNHENYYGDVGGWREYLRANI